MSDPLKQPGAQREPQSLDQIVSHLLEECRMVLPGIQAIFGFQLVAVFDNRFKEFTSQEQVAHLVSVSLMVLAMGAVLTPAAYHRIAETHSISEKLVTLASFLLTLGMFFLMCSLVIDLYLIARMITQSVTVAAIVASLGTAILGTLWFLFPFSCRRKNGGCP